MRLQISCQIFLVLCIHGLFTYGIMIQLFNGILDRIQDLALQVSAAQIGNLFRPKVLKEATITEIHARLLKRDQLSGDCLLSSMFYEVSKERSSSFTLSTPLNAPPKTVS